MAYNRFTYLTRTDDGIDCGLYNSVEWALHAHVKQRDTGIFKAAILVGNEDAPERIMFYDHENITVDSVPVFTWHERKSDAGWPVDRTPFAFPGKSKQVTP